MTYLISRANYQRCTEGMTDAERADFDRDFVCYPDRPSPDARIDLDQVADRYARLVAQETGMPPLLTFEQVRQRTPFAGWDLVTTTEPYSVTWVSCARGNGKSAWQPPDPWRELGEGCYVAPAGTLAPFFTPDGGPAPTIRELEENCRDRWGPPFDDFIDVDTLLGGWATAHDAVHRFYLNSWVEERPADPRADMLAAKRKLDQMDLPRPQRLAAGEDALGAIAVTAARRLKATSGVMAELGEVPIVADPDLPADAWQLVDAETGEVVHEGTISPALAAMLQAIRDVTDEVADRAGMPRDLFY
jgi:hypothetical protein